MDMTEFDKNMVNIVDSNIKMTGSGELDNEHFDDIFNKIQAEDDR